MTPTLLLLRRCPLRAPSKLWLGIYKIATDIFLEFDFNKNYDGIYVIFLVANFQMIQSGANLHLSKTYQGLHHEQHI